MLDKEILDKFTEMVKRTTPLLDKSEKERPLHVAVTIRGNLAWAKKKNNDLATAFTKSFQLLHEWIDEQVQQQVPMMTYLLLSEEMHNAAVFPVFLEHLSVFLTMLQGDESIDRNHIRITFLGKWYDLPGRVVDTMKALGEKTKDYDHYFLNFCMNYDGQQEIVDAFKLLARKIKENKLEPESITPALVKENLYTSFFIPPDLQLITGTTRTLSGLLLWDSMSSRIVFSDKPWPEMTRQDFKDLML
ncbi:di-trans,poly-cis-decaprenylcistransferase [Candidatus Woesearchaeota archaeon]|nr:di-trans,poly-cis-decaprenylcistransferase [Candidatus Woesearchaeota archaeon]